MSLKHFVLRVFAANKKVTLLNGRPNVTYRQTNILPDKQTASYRYSYTVQSLAFQDGGQKYSRKYSNEGEKED